MLKRSIHNTQPFTAGDQTIIREVLHPKNEAVDLPYSLAYATLAPDEASLPHVLQHSSEVYVFVGGSGQVFVDEEFTAVQAGDVIHIPAGAEQYVQNTGDGPLEFWCIVAPPWSASGELVR